MDLKDLYAKFHKTKNLVGRIRDAQSKMQNIENKRDICKILIAKNLRDEGLGLNPEQKKCSRSIGISELRGRVRWWFDRFLASSPRAEVARSTYEVFKDRGEQLSYYFQSSKSLGAVFDFPEVFIWLGLLKLAGIRRVWGLDISFRNREAERQHGGRRTRCPS